jgi:hypothetical protein
VRYPGFKAKEPETPASKSKAATRSVSGALRIGDPNDGYEQEADRVADEVMSGRPGKRHWSLSSMSMAALPLQRKCSCGGSAGSTGECEECKQKKEEQTVQRKAAGPAGPTVVPPIVYGVLHSPGRPLDRATRDFFEPKFGHDFSDVRVHTGLQAANSAHALNASAYTIGSDVVFGSGASPHQKPLLAHELAHVVQQSGLPATAMASEDAPLEAEAEHTASAISGGSSFANIHAKSAPRISRQTPPAPATSPVLSFLTSQDIAKLQAFGNADYQASLDTLEKMLRITGDLTQDGLPRQYVSTRQASGELRTFLDLVRNPDIQAMKVVPSAAGGRSPDFYYRQVGGAGGRVEVVNITSASSTARAQAKPGEGGATARRIPSREGSVVTQVEEIDSVAKLRQAIRVKIKSGSQLSAQNRNTQVEGRPMEVGGEIRVSTSHIELSKGEIDGVIEGLQSELADSSATRVVVDTVDKAEPRAGRKLFEYVRNDEQRFVYSRTRVSFARANAPPITGAATAPDVSTPPTGATAEGSVPEAAVEGATRAEAAEGAVAGGAAEAEAIGVAARVAGFALEAAAGLVIGIAVGLFLEWLKGVIEEAVLKSDLEALKPNIQAKLQELSPKINKLEERNSKVYSRVTIDVTRRVGTAIGGEGGFSGFASWDHYEGVALLGVDVAGDTAPNQRSERQERLSANEDRKHSVETFSALIDDPPKRKREAETKKALEQLRTAKPSKPAAPPPAPASQPQPKPFTPLPVPAPPSAPSVQFLAPPGGPSQEPRVEEMVAYFKAQALNLKSRGERLLSSSPSKEEVAAFLNDEAIWRNQVTVWDNHYVEKGPDFGHRGMDELRNSDEYGGRLKQIRQNLGG